MGGPCGYADRRHHLRVPDVRAAGVHALSLQAVASTFESRRIQTSNRPMSDGKKTMQERSAICTTCAHPEPIDSKALIQKTSPKPGRKFRKMRTDHTSAGPADRPGHHLADQVSSQEHPQRLTGSNSAIRGRGSRLVRSPIGELWSLVCGQAAKLIHCGECGILRAERRGFR